MLPQLRLFVDERRLDQLVHLVAEEDVVEIAGLLAINHLLQAGQVLRAVVVAQQLLVRQQRRLLIARGAGRSQRHSQNFVKKAVSLLAELEYDAWLAAHHRVILVQVAVRLRAKVLEVLLLGDLDDVSEHAPHDVFPGEHGVVGLVDGEALGDVGFELVTHLVFFVPEDAVPVVLDVVVGAAEDDLGQLRPPILLAVLHMEKNPVLLNAPVQLVQQRVQLIAPALATLLA